jgi:hypothetical protein
VCNISWHVIFVWLVVSPLPKWEFGGTHLVGCTQHILYLLNYFSYLRPTPSNRKRSHIKIWVLFEEWSCQPLRKLPTCSYTQNSEEEKVIISRWRFEIRVAERRMGRQNCTLCAMVTKAHNKGHCYKIIYVHIVVILPWRPSRRVQ